MLCLNATAQQKDALTLVLGRRLAPVGHLWRSGRAALEVQQAGHASCPNDCQLGDGRRPAASLC